MTPLQELFLILALLYLWECCYWLPGTAVLLIDGRRARRRVPPGAFGDRRSGLAVGPLRPWVASYVVNPARRPWGRPGPAVVSRPPTSLPPPAPWSGCARPAGRSAELLAPPRRHDPTSLSYCPRCEEVYRLRSGHCSGCPGVALVAFSEP